MAQPHMYNEDQQAASQVLGQGEDRPLLTQEKVMGVPPGTPQNISDADEIRQCTATLGCCLYFLEHVFGLSHVLEPDVRTAVTETLDNAKEAAKRLDALAAVMIERPALSEVLREKATLHQGKGFYADGFAQGLSYAADIATTRGHV